ncbi:MAG: sporulation transcriptional regulator SpoIIID [Firmicutes bacterium]|nr:sporulation transcriptional regulator SpoIIID [Bacillota bacterium]MDD4264790.1 sporulation transcriptional regulator SpoIIID [Bacillota bacterium]MDD4693596.1 sporulation transcriptional regulator SpoIIID [Bacillota bacterium]
MKDYIRTRVLDIAAYLLSTGETVRQAAEVFHVSKSTVHKDVTERLEKINKELYEEVSRVLAHNKAERHIRGGEATKKKYISKRKQKYH